MFKDVIDKLNKTEQEIRDLKRDKAQAEHLLALVMSNIGELDIDMTNLYAANYDKIKLFPDEDNRMKVKLVYEEESTTTTT